MRKLSVFHLLVILIILAAVVIPYRSLFHLVGQFPAEGLNDGVEGSLYRSSFCKEYRSPVLNEFLWKNYGAESQFRSVDGLVLNPWVGYPASISNANTLELTAKAGNNVYLSHIINTSNSLYVSNEGRIIAIGHLSSADVSDLLLMKTAGYISGDKLDLFLGDVDKQFQKCSMPATDVGVTEGYWAAKGTSILHHWVHLYEAVLPGEGRLVQYGYLVPYAAKMLSDYYEPGPTGFVKSAWIIYSILAIIYVFVFLYLFRRNFLIASLFLFFKIFCFFKLTQFSILLAPGYHWFRELVFIAIPLCVYVVWSRMESGRNVPIFLCVASILCLLVCYLLDPLFFIIGMVCFFLSLLVIYFRGCLALLKKYWYVFFAVFLLFVVGCFFQSEKLLYVINQLKNGGHGLFVPDRRILSICYFLIFASLFFIYLSFGRRDRCLGVYFSFVSILSVLYFFVTPDGFHFIKYVEYSVPAAVSVFLVIFEFISKRIRLPQFFAGIDWKLASLIVCASLFVIVSKKFKEMPGGYQLRVKDSYGQKFFTAQRFDINDRVMVANLSASVINHLRSFPVDSRPDLIISVYDKYISFIYNVRNGFMDPDLVSWLDSADRLLDLTLRLKNSPRPLRVLIDSRVHEVDVYGGMDIDHSFLSSLYMAEKVNLKNRLRVRDLAVFAAANCNQIGSRKKDWVLYACGHGAR